MIRERPTEIRPWGSFYVLDESPTFKVKRLVVTPGGRLSLQSHRFRAEHWTVVNGTATVTIQSEVRILLRGDSVDIRLGDIHRLENHGDDDVEIIEVQYGSYFGEDDIIRYEDAYSRHVSAEVA